MATHHPTDPSSRDRGRALLLSRGVVLVALVFCGALSAFLISRLPEWMARNDEALRVHAQLRQRQEAASIENARLEAARKRVNGVNPVGVDPQGHLVLPPDDPNLDLLFRELGVVRPNEVVFQSQNPAPPPADAPPLSAAPSPATHPVATARGRPAPPHP